MSLFLSLPRTSIHPFISPSTHSPDLDLPPKLTWPGPPRLLPAVFFPAVLTGAFEVCHMVVADGLGICHQPPNRQMPTLLLDIGA